jgi:dienelactone hydrolase
MRRWFVFLVLVWMASGCAPVQQAGQPGLANLTAAPSATAQTPTPVATATPSPSPFPSATATADPYEAYTIDYLRARSYGGGELEITQSLGNNGRFMRYLVRYPSDGLNIDGFMNVPLGDGPFPVVIALHGYIDPAIYNTFDYTTRYADALANAGFLVIHPNLRGYKPSDDGDNLFRVGMAEDVLNLIALVKAQGGQAGPLEKADPSRIGLWGHSMGGGITTRVITVSPDVKAAILYAPMSGDEEKNYKAIEGWSNGTRGLAELAVPASALPAISPEFFFDGITAAVSINQGTADGTVMPAWSHHTCDLLKSLGKTIECNFYDGEPHTFNGPGDEQFMRNAIDFLNRYLLP